MGDHLQELNRKELKELCSRNNIRTAGVKHEDLVRLLRSKMYPHTPRSMRARSPKVLSPGKEDENPYKTPGKAAPGTGRNLRSSTLPREDVATTPRKTLGSSRKPLLAKSNTMSSLLRSNLPTKTSGAEPDATQEHFVRRLCECCNGLSPYRKGPLDAASKASRLSVVNSNGRTEKTPSARTSEGNANSPAASEAGSDASRRISESATDAGPDTLSDFSDADELRSVSSEPVSKLRSTSKRSPQEASQKAHCSKLSSFTQAGTWDHARDPSRDYISRLAGDGKNAEEDRDVPEDIIFPEFPEGSSFLVGDSEGLDLSFLRYGAADPEVISNGSDHEGGQTNGRNHAVKELDVMDSPMARDYVNYTRGSETDTKETGADSNRVSIRELTSDLTSENPGDLNMENSGATSIDVEDEQRDSTAVIPAEDAESREVLHVNDLAPGNEGSWKSKQSYRGGVVNSKHGASIPEDFDDGHEIHSELPCFESNSPSFDLKDFCVAKKLVFEPEGDVTPSLSLRQREEEKGGEVASNFQYSEGESVPSEPVTCEDDADSSSHAKSIPPLAEPAPSVPETCEDDESSSHAKSVPSLEEPAPSVPETFEDDESCSHAKSIPPVDEPALSVPKTCEDDADSSSHAKSISPLDEPKSQHVGLAETVSETLPPAIDEISSSDVDCGEQDVSNSVDRDGVAEELDAPAQQKDAGTPSSGHQLESELADSRWVPSEGVDSFEAEEKPDASTHLEVSPNPKQPVLSDASLTNKSSSNVAPQNLDRSNSSAKEQEGCDVKARDGEGASTSTSVPDYNNREEDEKDTTSFPLRIIFWCSKWCSLVSRNRTPRLGSYGNIMETSQDSW